MRVNDLVLLVGSITGAVGGVGALWLGVKKHKAEERVADTGHRVADVEQRVAEWTAINNRVEADNVRLRSDNAALRSDNDRLRGELHDIRSTVAALHKPPEQDVNRDDLPG